MTGLASQKNAGLSCHQCQSLGTRREELLIKPDVLQKIWVLRKLLYPMDDIEAMEFLLDKIKATKSDADFFDSMRRV